MFNLEKKICVVTGGNKGIGRAIVEKFAAAGAEIVYALARDEVALQDVADKYENVIGVKLDVTDVEGIINFAEKLKKEHGRVDVLVNNAGVTRDKLINKMTSEDWDYVININLKGLFNMTRSISPIMVANGSGSIVNISSVVALIGNPGQTNYAAAKGGVLAMTKTWAKEFTMRKGKIRVNAIAPGFTKTAMVDKVPQAILEYVKEKILLKTLGDPEDIANAALYFASDASKYVTAQTLTVDGGMLF